MSALRDTKKVPASNLKLKKLVDWKIFELQSVLVSDDVDVESVNESLLWFQPRHFSEVLEERVNDDKCGYPLCANPLDDKNNASYRINYAEKKIYSIELSKNYCCVDCIEKAQLLEKRFDDSVPYSRSVTKTLDLTAPVQSNIEEVLNVLAPSSKQEENKKVATAITELPPPPIYTSSVLSDQGALEVQFVDGLPVPAGAAGAGADIPASSEHKDNLKEHAGPFSPTNRSKFDHLGSAAMDEDTLDQKEASSHTTTASQTGSALHREVYHNRATATADATVSMETLRLEEHPRTQSTHSDIHLKSEVSGGSTVQGSSNSGSNNSAAPSMAEMFATMNALREKHKLTNPSTVPTPNSTRFTNGSLLEKSPAPIKKDIITSVTTPSVVRAGTLGRRPGPRNVKWGADSSTAIDSTAPVSAMNAMQIETKQDVKQEVTKDTEKLKVDVGQTEVGDKNINLVSAQPSILKNTSVSAVLVVTEKPPAPSGVKRSVSQLSGQVVERVNPRPLSAAAMMRKRETEYDTNENKGGKAVNAISGAGALARTMLGSASSGAILQRTAAPSTLTHINRAGRSAAAAQVSVDGSSEGLGMYDRDELDRGDDEGDQWVDVDPQELLQLGYMHPGSGGPSSGADSAAMAMSIEGYIANVKKNIRVSPATTIKNLSHSPYIYQDINHHVNAANASASHNDDGTMDLSEEEQEATEEMDPTSDNEADFDTAHNADEGGEGGDEPWESEDEMEENDQEIKNRTVEAPPGQSLFLTVWATMDELFGSSLNAVFQDNNNKDSSGSSDGTDGGSQDGAEAVVTSIAPVVEDQYSEPAGMSRPPIALEQQNAQHAFVKLLQRGIQSAESQLNLHSLCLTLQEERSLYGLIKHKLLSTANNTLQRRNNLSSTLGASNAGTGLHSAGWTLIGLLVIDAVVTKKQIGPLRRKQAAEAGNDKDALVTKDVAVEAWHRLIERTAVEVLNAAANRRNSQVNKLREGDLQILRSYFDYI